MRWEKTLIQTTLLRLSLKDIGCLVSAKYDKLIHYISEKPFGNFPTKPLDFFKHEILVPLLSAKWKCGKQTRSLLSIALKSKEIQEQRYMYLILNTNFAGPIPFQLQ